MKSCFSSLTQEFGTEALYNFFGLVLFFLEINRSWTSVKAKISLDLYFSNDIWNWKLKAPTLNFYILKLSSNCVINVTIFCHLFWCKQRPCVSLKALKSTSLVYFVPLKYSSNFPIYLSCRLSISVRQCFVFANLLKSLWTISSPTYIPPWNFGLLNLWSGNWNTTLWSQFGQIETSYSHCKN